MRIGIDCRLAGSKHAGIGRYTESLVQNLIDTKTKISWILFFHDQNQAENVLGERFHNKNIQIILTPISHYSIEEQIRMPQEFLSQKLDLLHVPHFNIPIFYKGKFVVTIHDLLWHEYKGGTATTLSPIKYFLKYLFYKLVTRMAVGKAEKILVPAKTIKDTVIKFYPKSSKKIVVTKEGGTIWDKKITRKKKLEKTLLYVGSLYPHKNIRLVLRSLKQLPDHKLLIVGSRNVFREKVEEYVKSLDIQDQVEFLGYLDDQALAELYTQVSALIQPSFSEGFGLTGVEAMSLGTPILASEIPIFNEIYQDAPFYFSPHSESSFTNAVHELESRKPVVNKKIKAGIELSKTYNWKDMSEKTLKVYKEVLADN